jgi:hypothetical protein
LIFVWANEFAATESEIGLRRFSCAAYGKALSQGEIL